ncbi:E3 ubiquitin-protein ligase RNF34-like isoform X3 [Babylonia areolata]|uniref:E3 ubiquitin-protein ligase RNF34-like isoform X3 n=1 Tax=Babylonia areolata TaxID=304850 RepID=UPI003FD0FEF5
MGTGAVGGHRVSPEDSQILSHTSPSSAAVRSDARDTEDRVGSTTASVGSSSTRMPATSSTSVSRMPNKVVSCETCDNSFGFFKRKKICKDCHRIFCSTCLPKPPSSLKLNGRQCDKCTILTSGKFTRQQLLAWRVKDMRCFLDVRNIPTSTCKEKHDLIDLLLLHFCLESSSVLREQREHDRLVGQLADRMRSGSFYSTPTTTTTTTTTLPHQVPEEETSPPAAVDVEDVPEQDPADHLPSHTPSSSQPSPTSSQPQEGRGVETGASRSQEGWGEEDSNVRIFITEHLRQRQMREMREAETRLQEELEQDEPETRPGIQRASIDDLDSAEGAEKLTVRQLKEILANNFVDYRGCCEKHELVDRVKRLWVETQANKQRAAATESNPNDPTVPAPSGTGGADPEQDVCKICMDAAIDCILLECGHMITCSKCGKRLADCPICRQYITRVVHVFRS